MSKKRKIIYITIAAAIVIIAALAIIFMPKAAPQTVTEMLSTAQKYLVEMDYERAIAEFNKVIELDPMNADAYLGLAEAYEKSGDIDKAVETLEKGFELTGDERLKARLALLNGENEEITETTAETEVSEEFITIKGERYSTRLTELSLRNLELTDSDIKELNKLTNLTYLDLYDNQISDIGVLSDLTNLKYLCLGRNQISDISALSKLTNLEELYLFENQIGDVSTLSGLTNLTVLEIWINQINDISCLESLTKLTKLDVTINQISNISVISQFTELTYLGLSVNEIHDISALSSLKNLSYLGLDNNQITDITAIKNLTNLEYICIWDNNLLESDIESLKSSLPNCDIEY